MTAGELLELAEKARSHAYAPYSHFTVGAALLCSDGSVYTGCNIENAAFTPTVCAERVAVFRAVADGKRDFRSIAVCGGPLGETAGDCTPCGVCRQVLREFCDPDTFQIYVNQGLNTVEYLLRELLPAGFGPETLPKSQKTSGEDCS